MKFRFFSSKLMVAMAVAAFFAASLTAADPAKPFKVAVFVPGVVQGSPTYEMMVAGVQAAKDSAAKNGKTITIKVLEAGFQQSQWQDSLTALASGDFDLIVSSNPSLPDIAAAVSKSLPNKKFLLLDGSLSGNPAIKTIDFDNYQQAYLNGYYAALVSTSPLNKNKGNLVIGLLAGQEYPVMNQQIRTGYADGAKAVNPGFKVDFRVLGNWYDAAKAQSLAKSMIDAQVSVILTIAGGGNQGVIAAAKEAGAYVTWFDDARYAGNPETVIGSSLVKQTEFCSAAVLKALDGSLDYGKASRVGIKDDAVGFDFDNPGFKKLAPANAAKAMKDLIAAIKSGKIQVAAKP